MLAIKIANIYIVNNTFYMRLEKNVTSRQFSNSIYAEFVALKISFVISINSPLENTRVKFVFSRVSLKECKNVACSRIGVNLCTVNLFFIPIRLS